MNGHLKVQLRQWKEEDLPYYADMNSDPRVMEYFPRLLNREESEESYNRIRKKIERDGWGLWAVDVHGVFAGYTGLAVPSFEAAFTPCVEIAWRLRREYWGSGVAIAAARLAEEHAFKALNLDRLYSFTARTNIRSWRLMEKLGFEKVMGGEFHHPKIARESPLSLHVLYTKQNPHLPTANSATQ